MDLIFADKENNGTRFGKPLYLLPQLVLIIQNQYRAVTVIYLLPFIDLYSIVN